MKMYFLLNMRMSFQPATVDGSEIRLTPWDVFSIPGKQLDEPFQPQLVSLPPDF